MTSESWRPIDSDHRYICNCNARRGRAPRKLFISRSATLMANAASSASSTATAARHAVGAVARDPGGLLEAGATPDLVVSEPGGTVKNSVRDAMMMERRDHQSSIITWLQRETFWISFLPVTIRLRFSARTASGRSELELPPKDRTCSGLRFRADEFAWRLIP